MGTKISRTLERTILDNGVRILSSHMKGETVAFGFGFNHGAIFDPPEFDGLSHGVEHFLLKAAPGYPYRRASRLLEECGSVTAQTTKFRILVSHLTVISGRQKKNFRRAFRVLSKLVSEPTFNDQEFGLEKEAVIHEIEETEADPSWQAYEFLYEILFGKENPLARTIIGTSDILKRLTRETIIEYYRSLFNPKRIVIVSHGNLAHRTLVYAVEAFFRRRERNLKKEGFVQASVSTHQFRYAEVERMMQKLPPVNIETRPEPRRSEKLPEDLGGIAIGCRVPPLHSKYRYALEVLKSIVGGHLLEDMILYSGDLFYELRERRGLFYHPDEIDYEASPWSGCFYLRFKTNHSLIEQAEERTLELFRSYRREGIRREQIDSAKRKIESHYRIMRIKHDFQFLDWMLKAEISGRPEEPDEFIKNIKGVTRKSIMEAIEQFFDPDTQLVRALIYPAQK